ncbi:hypothetical protein Tco_0679565 [Tanacetum coccineum]|uniref:Uncharacterized protein n=1 Tax=Tanacetum coccineum TaxID=301880 RepID=A0ABQ4XJ36_9ASTR
MAQAQTQADVHPDELCPPNKRYALMDANKKIDLDNPLCPIESKILANILQNHPLRFSIDASSSVPWIYLGKFWHTLKEDGSKYRLTFMLDRKEITMTLGDFRTIIQLPQARDNNHECFVAAPKFSEMAPFFLKDLGFILELRSPSKFKTTGLVQPWQTLCKIFARCLTTRVIGLHYALEHPATLIPYPRFTKLIVSHYMTEFPEISRRVRDKYHNIEDDQMMKLTENYRLYAKAFGVEVDVPTTQSQPIKSTQGTHRTPNPDVHEEKSREEQEAKQNVEKVKEHFVEEEIEKMMEETKDEDTKNLVDETEKTLTNDQEDPGTRLEPGSYKESSEVKITAEVPVNVVEEEEEAEDNVYELKRREKGKFVEETRDTPLPTTLRSPRIHSTLVSSDTEKLQELTETEPTPSSDTPSSSSPKPTSSMAQHMLSLFKPKAGRFKRYKNFFDEIQGRYGYLFGHLKKRFMPRKKFHVLAKHLQDIMEESLPAMINNVIINYIPSQVDSLVRSYISNHVLHVHPTQASQATVHEQQYQLYLTMKDDPQLQHDDISIWLVLKIKFESLATSNTLCRPSAIRPRDQDDPNDDASPEGENRAKSEPGPSTTGNQEQVDDFDFWTDKYATDDDELPSDKVSQELVKEMSETVDEAKLHKVFDEMMRQQCTSGDEHQYHIDQMQNFLKSDIVWESRKEILSLPQPQRSTPIKGNTGPEKIVLSLHKYHAVIFPDDDIEERTSRWVDKCVKKFNPRENGSIVSITEPDYKYLNKNDIEDMYLLYINGKLGVESYQQNVNLTAPTITFSGIEKYKMLSIVFEPIYGIIYENSKNEKRVMGHKEIHKFCDAILKRVLVRLKSYNNSYNNDVKHGYVSPSLSDEDAECLQLFK